MSRSGRRGMATTPSCERFYRSQLKVSKYPCIRTPAPNSMYTPINTQPYANTNPLVSLLSSIILPHSNNNRNRYTSRSSLRSAFPAQRFP
jgi:hypothetical protein